MLINILRYILLLVKKVLTSLLNFKFFKMNKVLLLMKARPLSKMRLLLLALFSLAIAFTNAQTIQLGSGTSTANNFPINYNWGYNYTQTIYTVAEMQAQGASASGGTITKIRFKPNNSVATTLWANWVVYLGNTTQTNFASTTNWVPFASLTEVFNGTIPANLTAGQWMELTLTTPFLWNGTDNIVVAIDENTPSYGSMPSWSSYTLAPPTGSKGIYYCNDSTNPDPAAPPTASGTTSAVAQIQFDGTLMDVCSGTPTGGTTALTPTSGNPNSAIAGSVTGATVASGLTYQWQYSDDAGATWINIVGQNSTALSTTAMSVYGTRDYRRATICGTDSAFSTPATFTTQLTYCVPTTSYTGDYISTFSTTNAIQNVTYTGSSNTAYVNKSGVDTIKAIIGTPFNFSLAYVGGSNTIRIWVDWGGDGTFDATDEVFVSSPTGAASPQSGTITIPGATLQGNYRMRVRASYGSSVPPACGNVSYGTTIDYTLLAISLPVSPSITQEATAPTCTDGTDLSTTGTPGTNEAWYWQTTATGTSTANDATTPWTVFENGTYYARAYNTLYSVWGDATSYTVTNMPTAPVPATPTAAANPACMSTTISVAAAPTGVVYYWQGTDNTSSLTTDNAVNPYTVSATGTYYVKAYETATQCWSDPVGVTVTIDTIIPNAPIANPSQYNICSSSTTSMISADATIQTLGSLTTTTAGGNGCTNGNMFNITALTSTIEVNSFDIIPYATGTQTVNVYQKNGTYVGSETNSGAWTLIGSYPINGTMGVLYNLDIDDFSIPAGSTKGVYIDFNAQYTTVTAGTTYSNTDISVAVGAGLCAAFSSVNTPRAFNGNINYTVSTPSATVNWYDAATGGNLVGNGSPLEAVGTSVLSSPATNGEYHFYAESVIGGCNNPTRTLVTVYVNDVNVDLLPVDASCNNGADGSFVLSNVYCGTAPFTYAIDGSSTFGAIPTDLSTGQHTVVVKDNAGNVSAPYTITIGGAAGPSGVVVSTYTNNQATVNWVANGAETSWTIEWGVPGFTPGTGTQIGTANVADTFYTITGLEGDSTYDIYVTTNCGSPYVDWGSTSVHTDCDPMAALGYCESFEDVPALGCWKVINANGDGDYWQVNTSGYYANTGTNALQMYTDYNAGNNDDYVVLPYMTLTGNEVLSFHYRAMSSFEPNDFEILLSTTGSNPADFTNVIYTDTVDNTTYRDTSINLSSFTGNVYIAFHIPNGGLDGYYLYIDDICINICNPVPGNDGMETVCRTQNTIDLSTVITSPYSNGTWEFTANQSLINGSIMNVSTLAAGTYHINYLVHGACTTDTTIAVITVQNPSSAGTNGLITACKNQPIDLFGGLSGNVDFGGTWYRPNGTAMTGSYFTTGTLVGQQVYKYIVSNGVCGPDTAEVTVNIQNCDYLGLDDLSVLDNVTIAPNPNTGNFQILGIPGADFTYEVLDLNGRLVVNTTKITSTITDVKLTDVQDGVYLVRIKGNNSERMIRVIKQN